jgi:hypothetical protein
MESTLVPLLLVLPGDEAWSTPVIREFANVRERFCARGSKANGGGLFSAAAVVSRKCLVFSSSSRPVKFPFV